MACGKLYKDAIVVTTVKKVSAKRRDAYVLDLPFKIYGQDIVRNGQIVTYSLEKLEGQEVMAKVDFKIEDESEVKKFSGYLGGSMSGPKYLQHYPITNADARATYTGDRNSKTKVPYDGADKNDLAPFCEALIFKEEK